MKISFKIMALLALFMLPTISEAQFYTVYKTDGETVQYKHTDIDSIVFTPYQSVGNDPVEINGHYAVDLGLSVKWAICNVGAENPEEIGGYYSWGDIKTKNSYVYNNTTCANNKMKDISGNAQYDAATYNWGSPWRMPTLTEAKELIEKCTYKTTTINTVDGFLLVGPNGNSIFLPFTGSKMGTDFYNENDIFYWTSSTDESRVSSSAAALWSYVKQDGDRIYYSEYWTRVRGLAIRAVTK